MVIVHERSQAADWTRELVRRHLPADASLLAASEASRKGFKEIAAARARGEEPEGAYHCVTVYEVDGDEATPLAPDWFAGPHDQRYGHTKAGYCQLSTERD